MRIHPMVVVVALILIALSNGYALKFVAYGDSRTNASTHASVVAAFAKENPELVIHSGDLWDGYTSSQWLGHFTANSVTKALLNNNKILVAKGNHETSSEVLGVSPTIVRDNSILYSFTEGNCFFVCMGYDPGTNNTWLETQLKSSESQAADWRFIFVHKPIYSTGSHGANGTTSSGSSITNFRKLCDDYKVAMVLSGHDHIYERTYLIYSGAVVTNATDINITKTPGTIYTVTGGGGAPLYSVGSKWWTAVGEAIYHYTVLDATAKTLSFTAKTTSGKVIDQVTFTKSTTSSMSISSPKNWGIGIESYRGKIFYTIPFTNKLNSQIVNISLFDLRGKFVTTLLNDKASGGTHSISLDKKLNASGVYLCRIKSNSLNKTITVSIEK